MLNPLSVSRTIRETYHHLRISTEVLGIPPGVSEYGYDISIRNAMEESTGIWDKIFIHAMQIGSYVSRNRFTRTAVSVLRTKAKIWREISRR